MVLIVWPLASETPVDGQPATPGNGVHIAFEAPDRACVRRFHEMALGLGVEDAAAPRDCGWSTAPITTVLLFEILMANKIEVVCESAE
jgi:hypothetical protein